MQYKENQRPHSIIRIVNQIIFPIKLPGKAIIYLFSGKIIKKQYV